MVSVQPWSISDILDPRDPGEESTVVSSRRSSVGESLGLGRKLGKELQLR